MNVFKESLMHELKKKLKTLDDEKERENYLSFMNSIKNQLESNQNRSKIIKDLKLLTYFADTNNELSKTDYLVFENGILITNPTEMKPPTFTLPNMSSFVCNEQTMGVPWEYVISLSIIISNSYIFSKLV